MTRVFSEKISTRATMRPELKASDVGLEFLTGELKGSHDPSGIVFTVLAAMSGMERESRPHPRRPRIRPQAWQDHRRGRHPSAATVMRMLREHDEQAATAAGA